MKIKTPVQEQMHSDARIKTHLHAQSAHLVPPTLNHERMPFNDNHMSSTCDWPKKSSHCMSWRQVIQALSLQRPKHPHIGVYIIVQSMCAHSWMSNTQQHDSADPMKPESLYTKENTNVSSYSCRCKGVPSFNPSEACDFRQHILRRFSVHPILGLVAAANSPGLAGRRAWHLQLQYLRL